MLWESFAAKILNKEQKDTASNGLVVGLDDLMSMRRYVPFMRVYHQQKASSFDSGELKSMFKGRGIEMEEVREYHFGDDVRDIDWRVTARMGEAYTKVYTAERNREIYVWLDLSPIMLFGSTKELKSVTAAKIAALLGWMALDNKDRFGCVIFDGEHSWNFSPKGDRANISAICKKIAEVSEKSLYNQINSAEERKKSLKLLSRQARKGGNIFLISSFLFWNDDYDSEISYIAKANNSVLLNIYDELERKAPPSGQYMAEFAGEKFVFDSSDRSYKKNYKEYFADKNKALADRCKLLGCQLLDLSQNSVLTGKLKIL